MLSVLLYSTCEQYKGYHLPILHRAFKELGHNMWRLLLQTNCEQYKGYDLSILNSETFRLVISRPWSQYVKVTAPSNLWAVHRLWLAHTTQLEFSFDNSKPWLQHVKDTAPSHLCAVHGLCFAHGYHCILKDINFGITIILHSFLLGLWKTKKGGYALCIGLFINILQNILSFN